MQTKTICLLAVLLAPLASAQEVSRLEISRGPDGAESRSSIDLYLSLDVSTLDFNNPLDTERTRLAVAKDDAGGDLLAAHEAMNAEWREQGYEVEAPISFAGIGDYAASKDAKVAIVLKAAPATGARVIELEGTVALNFIAAASASKTTLQAMPTASEWGSPGTDTPIGPVRIEPSASMFVDDVQYQGYQVISPNAPVIAVAVVGGDASEEARNMGMGLEPGMFVIKGDAPPTVDLHVTYAATETREIPFKLSFGVGL